MIEISVKTTEGMRYVPAYTIDDFPYKRLFYGYEIVRGKHRNYVNLASAFDIEASTITRGEEHTGFMYLWQFCIRDTVVMGRTWNEFQTFLYKLDDALDLSPNKRLVVYVHNLPYEFQFMRNFFKFEKIFAKDKRDIVKCDIGNVEFRCSYALSNMSLAKFCETSKLCTFIKQDGKKFDYHKLRTPETVLNNDELGYGYCDVRGLCQCIETLMIDDTIASIPLTSTGYVRREVRKAVKTKPDNQKKIKEIRLTPHLYDLCKKASRGGNTHANAIYSNQVLHDVKSYDIKSSYPAVMMSEKFPVTPFQEVGMVEKYPYYLENKACLIDCIFFGVSIKSLDIIPYIAKAKAIHVQDGQFDNGRIVEAKIVHMVLTDIDMKIIQEMYNIKYIEYNEFYISDYGYLNKEFRYKLLDYFYGKCTLADVDEYLYGKAKNKFNSMYGMMLTDICHSNWSYDEESEDCWVEEKADIQKALDKYYNSKNTFLSYQHGIWVTAHARNRLQQALNQVGRDVVYIDTDSVKYLGEHDDIFKKLNIEIIQKCESLDIPAYVEYKGRRIYLGIWEEDGEYNKFKTLGAKKYAYTDIKDKLHITVAGLNKKDGAEYIKKIEQFKIGKIVPAGESGRTTAYYNDDTEVYKLNVEGVEVETSSNVAIIDTSYTLGISTEYSSFLEYILNMEINS